jgi:hypothetical protein
LPVVWITTLRKQEKSAPVESTKMKSRTAPGQTTPESRAPERVNQVFQ